MAATSDSPQSHSGAAEGVLISSRSGSHRGGRRQLPAFFVSPGVLYSEAMNMKLSDKVTIELTVAQLQRLITMLAGATQTRRGTEWEIRQIFEKALDGKR